MTDKEIAVEAVIKKLEHHGIDLEYPYCPVCGHQMTSARATYMRRQQVYDYAYCESCGQKVKWS